MGKIKNLIKVSVLVLVLSVVLEIWAVNRLSAYGAKIQSLQSRQYELITENQLLEAQIAKSSSLLTLESQSSRLGFAAIQDIAYLKPVALASLP